MAKKKLIWEVSEGFLIGSTPKTRKAVYSYDLLDRLGTVGVIDESIDNHRSIGTSFLKDDPIYDWFFYQLEDMGLARHAVRTQQLMDLLQKWLIEARKAGNTDISVNL